MSSVENISNVNETTNSDDEMIQENYCTICMSDIRCDHKTTLKCNHSYHSTCYTSYIAHNVVNKKEYIECPVCRGNILHVVVQTPQVININDNNDNDTESDNITNDRLTSCFNLSFKMAFIGFKLSIICLLAMLMYYGIYCATSDVC